MNPYRIKLPGIISFSGGRTSGYMLYKCLEAWGGDFPNKVKVLFCNTGKEREETLEFVEECSQQWGVEIIWLEYRYIPLPIRYTKDGKPIALNQKSHSWEVVNFNTASRNGEPFDAIIKARNILREHKNAEGILPHVRGRFCTAELKTRTKGRYIKQHLGWGHYNNAIGIRADEQKRLKSLIGCDYVEDSSCRGEIPMCPLAEDDITEDDVMSFWKQQPFDLKLRQHEGNCDLCFLKSKAKIFDIIYRKPDSIKWWAEKELQIGDKFRIDRPSYAHLLPLAKPMETECSLDDLTDSCSCTD